MRQLLLVANWKLHKTLQESIAYVREFGVLVRHLDDAEVAVAPPFTALAAVAETARSTSVRVAAQDIAAERDGAFTGEVSAGMIKDAGADLAIIGHSERRRLFGDTDAIVNRKVRAALAERVVPILCIGETLEERDDHATLAVLDRQLEIGLDGVTGDDAGAMVIAYEPVWAIGTGRNATPDQAAEAHGHIRVRLRERFGQAPASTCRIIYGGSVKPNNIGSLTALADVDGALVGGASLDVRTFHEIVTGAVSGRRA